jgi:hypothetical protein
MLARPDLDVMKDGRVRGSETYADADCLEAWGVVACQQNVTVKASVILVNVMVVCAR